MIRSSIIESSVFWIVLGCSAAGHWGLAFVERPKRVVVINLQDREYGVTNVAIHLVATKSSERVDEKLPVALEEPIEVKTPPPKPKEIELERPDLPEEEIIVAALPRADAPMVPQAAAPEIERTEQLEEPKPEIPRTRRRRLTTEAQPRDDLVIEKTIIVDQSTGVDVQPKLLSNPDPHYPADLHARRIEGRLELTVMLGIDGRPTSVAVLTSSGYAGFDAAAIEAVKGWKFSAAQRNGQAVEQRVTVPIRFSIRRGA